MFKKINFHSGNIVYDDFQIDPELSFEKQMYNFKQDMFQVDFLNKYLIDIGWYPDFDKNGMFKIVIIKEYNWEKPFYIERCRTIDELKEHLVKCINIINNQLDI
ncbi:hypothetical protein [Chengkuizengella sediminis]|uniref:hypothetical protein n=1 Tax=Chengkuizengella sediminis TaxID=1885917 RepID=UPI0013895B57|nr:hypothetical protein [Chengkuizengella sediminis]NDI36660.1 hypothetical protein [Chengkuizengella sediminis]